MAGIKFNLSDGTGRAPRPVQVAALEWLEKNWDKTRFKIIQAPVGAGKSWVARTIQRATNAAVVTPSNILVRQYRHDYPEVNHLIGRKHYSCNSFAGLDCQSVCEAGIATKLTGDGSKTNYCTDCPYVAAKNRAKTEGTFYNPMSLMYSSRGERVPGSVIVVDEAHSLLSQLKELASKTFWKSEVGLPAKISSEIDVLNWLERIIPPLKVQQARYTEALGKTTGQAARAELAERLTEFEDTLSAIYSIRQGIKEDPQNYAFWYGEKKLRGKIEQCLNIRPLKLPRHIAAQFFSRYDHVVLTSGTILKHDREELTTDNPYSFIDMDSPIPRENRLVHHEPLPFAVNFQTDPAALARCILKTVRDNPGPTLIHVTYGWAAKLAPYMPSDVIINDKDSKDAALAKFKKEGGVWLAAAASEGIDLPYGLCRTNIIPVLAYPNMVDEVVRRRMALESGNEWYAMEMLKTLIQQAGRSTRAADDFSKTIILPPQFASVFKQYSHLLPASFVEAVVLKQK